MRRHRIALCVCTCLLAGLGRSQDENESSLVQAILAMEWKDFGAQQGVLHCLKALEDYTKPTPDPTAAMTELKAGIQPGPSAAVDMELLDLAQRDRKLQDLLATANTQPKSQSADDLFDMAEKAIKATFRRTPTTLSDGVDQEYARRPARALYNLLQLTWQDTSQSSSQAMELMDKYRACYNYHDAHDRLFNLVHKLYK